MRTLRGRAGWPAPRPGWPTVLVAIALGAALVATVPADALATGRPRRPAADTSWQPVWRDDFAGRAGLPPAGADWLADAGRSYPGGPDHWGTGEVELYTADAANLSQDGHGNLSITATRDKGGTWRSARIETVRADFQPRPGGRLRVEARLQLPAGGKGYWPAFWAIGAPFRLDRSDWPAPGEIDIMENVNSEATVHGTIHCGPVATGGPCHEGTGLTGAHRLDTPAGFHVYTLVWSTAPGRLDWYVDGRPFWSVTAATVGQPTWRTTTGHGFFLLLNLAVGGGWPGPPTAATRPGGSMLVDYVAVSRGGAQAEPVCGGAEHPQRFSGGAQAEPVCGGVEHPQRLPGGAQAEPGGAR
jgi:beta-glucanase (GH16 family)